MVCQFVSKGGAVAVKQKLHAQQGATITAALMRIFTSLLNGFRPASEFSYMLFPPVLCIL
jgi:hypothetical protein